MSDLKKNKVAKFLCQSDLLFYTRYFFKQNHKRKFVVGNHHKIICEALEKVLRGEITRLIINLPPRYGKSELAVKNFISHGIALNPSAKFIHLSYSDTLALDNSEEVRDMVASDAYKELFPNVSIKIDSKSKKKWYTTAGGGVYATSAAGQVTGFGAGNVDKDEEDLQININELNKSNLNQKLSFGGAIIIDDPIKPEDADSDVIRERVNQRFDSTIRTRTNSRNTPIIIIMHRLHVNDLAGYVQEKEPDVWTVISLPAIFTNDNNELESLWPFKHTLDELNMLRSVNDIVFDRQYMQNPKPKEGLMFSEDDLQFYNPEKVDVLALAEYKHMYIDPANEGGDDLAAPIGFLIKDKIYIHDIIYNNFGTDINEPLIIQTAVKYKVNSIEVEANSAWYLFSNNIFRKIDELRLRIDCRTIRNTTNKHTRIISQSAFIKNNFIFRSDWQHIPDYKKFMTVLTSYMKNKEGNKKDDAPDAATGLATYFAANFEHLY